MEEKHASGQPNSELLLALNAMGPLPGTEDPASETFDYQAFDTLIYRIGLPITAAEAQALLKLSPPTGEGAFGIEWALIHLIETLPLQELRRVLTQAGENEVQQTILGRLEP